MDLLSGFRVLQLGPGLAAAVCGRLLADAGAAVSCTDRQEPGLLGFYLDAGKHSIDASQAVAAATDLIVVEGRPQELRQRRHDLATIRRFNADAAVVFISPYGQTGPQADDPASDLTLCFASGISRLLTGQVDDLNEPPIRPAGEQSAFIAGIAAACAGMHAALGATPGAVIDVSIQEALATLAMTELARAGLTGKSWSRRRIADGNGATVCILPARDGYVAISPREGHQWASWLKVMGSPDWVHDPRFVHKHDRAANWDALHALMSAWSKQHDKQWIADAAQDAHVPSFPLREPAEQLRSPQLAHRRFFRKMEVNGGTVAAPGSPFGLHVVADAPASLAGEQEGSAAARRLDVRTPPPGLGPRRGPSPQGAGEHSGVLPLSGVRVLDFSWVIAGPTTTRYLAAMGADVIKVEAPSRGDPGRASELHTVLGQAKRGIVLDLKRPEAIAVAHALAAKSDVLIENFATGVMDRLGLGADALRAINPRLIFVSASGLGRSGPESHAVAYGTLLQCYAGFAGLNRHPNLPPRVGFAWLDPMCGLMLAFAVAAALWQRRRTGAVARVDFSMIEAMLWTMAEPLLAAQLNGPPQPRGNASNRDAPHGAWRCAGDDRWVGVAVTNDAAWRALCDVVPALAAMARLGVNDRMGQRDAIDAALSAWASKRSAFEAAATLTRAGVAAAALATSRDLVESSHLRARGFWEAHGSGVLPGLPWQASFGRRSAPAPELGEHTDYILRDMLHMSADDAARLRQAGAFG
ncbi:MAG TPA: CoA transferase [Acetobacteraceae bacterium]|nr:CoA transferase [Acetobacteraceae bacterium]